MPTHGIVRTELRDLQPFEIDPIGDNIIMPSGGPWLISGIYSYSPTHDVGNNAAVSTSLFVNSVSGDITPDPAPGMYPSTFLHTTGTSLSPLTVVPLVIFPVRWIAPSKSIISLSMKNLGTFSLRSHVLAGIIFDKQPIQPRPFTFSAVVAGKSIDSSEILLGTITLSAKSKRITGIYGQVVFTQHPNIAVSLSGFFRLSSDDVDISPAEYPASFATNEYQVTPAGRASMPPSIFIPVDIPVTSGARINIFRTLSTNSSGKEIFSTLFIGYE